MRALRRTSVIAFSVMMSAGLATPAQANTTSSPPVVVVTQAIEVPLQFSVAYTDDETGDVLDEPRQTSVNCNTRAHNSFSGTSKSGVISGSWHTRYHTSDCEVAGYDYEMSYMNVTHDTSRGSGGFWTSQISQCSSGDSGVCDGVTGTGRAVGCGPCNDSWTLTLHYTLIMPASAGRWQQHSNPPGTSGGCSISSSGKRLDCTFSKTNYLGSRGGEIVLFAEMG